MWEGYNGTQDQFEVVSGLLYLPMMMIMMIPTLC